MIRGHDRSIRMIEQQIEWISQSSFPESNTSVGMIQASLAHGFINQRESLELTERAYNAEAARRVALTNEIRLAGWQPSRMEILNEYFARLCTKSAETNLNSTGIQIE